MNSDNNMPSQAMELNQSEFERFFSIIPDLACIASTDGYFKKLNPAWEETLGHSSVELLSVPFIEFIHSEDIESTLREIEKQGSVRSTINLVNRYRCKDGSYRWFEWKTAPAVDDKLWFAVARDITERKQTDEEHKLTNFMLDSITDATIKFLSLVNASTGTRDLVTAVLTFFQEQSGCEAVGIRFREGDDYPYLETRGFPAQFIPAENRLCSLDDAGEVILDSSGNAVLDCMCGNVICGHCDPLKPFFTNGGSFWTNSMTQLRADTTESELQVRMRNRCNGEGYESVALIPLCNENKRLGLLQLNDHSKGRFSSGLICLWETLAGHLAVALDKFHAKEELRKSQELLQAVINGTSDIIYVKDLNGRYLLFNNEAARFVGKTADEVIGKDDTFLHPLDVVQSLTELDCAVISSGKAATFKEVVADAAGKLGTFLATKGPLFDEEGSITGIFGISRNVTDLVQAEETVRTNQEQLRSLAIELSLVEERERRRIATELHDEIGQNLALAKIKLDDTCRTRLSAYCAKPLKEIGDLIGRTIQEVRSLTFQISPPLLYEVGFEAAVEWLAEQFEDKYPLQILFSNDKFPEQLNEQLSSTLYHVVRELLVNVVKHAHAEKVWISLESDHDKIKIVVKDSGSGFDVSRPGKEREKLSGFGLFNIRQRIQHLGGELDIESKIGFGTKVTINVTLSGTQVAPATRAKNDKSHDRR